MYRITTRTQLMSKSIVSRVLAPINRHTASKLLAQLPSFVYNLFDMCARLLGRIHLCDTLPDISIGLCWIDILHQWVGSFAIRFSSFWSSNLLDLAFPILHFFIFFVQLKSWKMGKINHITVVKRSFASIKHLIRTHKTPTTTILNN